MTAQKYSEKELNDITDKDDLLNIFDATCKLFENQKGKSSFLSCIDAAHDKKICGGHSTFDKCYKKQWSGVKSPEVKLRQFILVLQDFMDMGVKPSNPTEITLIKTKEEELPIVATFICYLWKEDRIDFATLEFTSIINEEVSLGFTKSGEVIYKIYDSKGDIKYKPPQTGDFGKENDSLYAFTKGENKKLISFFLIHYGAEIFNENIKYFDGTFVTEWATGGSSSGVFVIERDENVKGRIKKLITKTEEPSPFILNYLYRKRVSTGSTAIFESSEVALPSKAQVDSISKISGIYEMYFINTRLEGIEREILIIDKSGLVNIIRNDEVYKASSMGFVTTSQNENLFLLYCYLDYSEDLKGFKRRIVLKEIEYNKNRYYHGILSGSSRTSAKPFTSRVRIKKISADTSQESIQKIKENDLFKVDIFKFDEGRFKTFIDNQDDLLRFLFGFIDDVKNGHGYFGDSLAYFNKIARQNFEVKKINHYIIDEESSRNLKNTTWEVYYYDSVEKQSSMNGHEVNYLHDGIAVGTLLIDEICHLQLNLFSKNPDESLPEIFNGYLTDFRGQILFAELVQMEEKQTIVETSRIYFKFRVFPSTNKLSNAVGIYTRIHGDKVITGYVALKQIKDKKNSPKFFEQKDNQFEQLDNSIKNFIYNHSKNAISLDTSTSFVNYTSKRNNKRYKKTRVYLTSPASFVWEENKRKDVYDKIKDDMLQVKEAIKSRINNDQMGIYCGFGTYEYDQLGKGESNIYIELQNRIKNSESLVMVYHSELNNYIGQTSMLIEFGWASILNIPIFLYQMDGTTLPNIIDSAIKNNKNIKLIKPNQSRGFMNVKEIIDYISTTNQSDTF